MTETAITEQDDGAVICTTCDDTGVVPPSDGKGSDGYDSCPDCVACPWCYGSGEWTENRQIVQCIRCDGSGRKGSERDVSPEGWEIVVDRERAKRRAGRGCGAHIGDDVAGISVRCGSLGLCQRCKNAGAGAETSDGSDLRDEGFLPRTVEGFTPAPDPATTTHEQPEWAYFAEALAWYPGHGLTGAQVFGVVQQVRQALTDGRITPADLGLGDES